MCLGAVMPCVCGCPHGTDEGSGPQGLKRQAGVSCLAWVLRMELGSSGRGGSALNCHATSQPLRGIHSNKCVAEPLKAPPLHIAVGLGYSRRHSSCSSTLCIDFSRDTFGGHFGRAVGSKASRNRVKLLRAAVKHFRVHASQAHSKMITSHDFSISLILQGFLNR